MSAAHPLISQVGYDSYSIKHIHKRVSTLPEINVPDLHKNEILNANQPAEGGQQELINSFGMNTSDKQVCLKINRSR